MKLSALIAALPPGSVVASQTADTELPVTGLTADSRMVEPGNLFFALAGVKTDGARFAAQAASRGAVAIVAALNSELTDIGVPVLRAEDPRQALARMAAAFFGPQPRVMAAVTGTAGKTSVASFLRQIWARAGEQAAMLGTTGVTAPGRTEYGTLTTPDPVALHRLLAELASEGVTHAAMEASSHGLDQRRLDGVALSVAGFTNLGRDHMDYHPTMDDYMAAKMRLFDTLLPKGAPAVIFADDPWSEKAVAVAERAGARVLTVGRKGGFLSLKRVEHLRDKQIAEVHMDGRIFEVQLPLAGDFQVANALVSAGLAIATGTSNPEPGDGGAGPSGRAPGPARTGRHDAERRAGLCRLCAQARGAGAGAAFRAAVHHRRGRRGVRRGRRPRPGKRPIMGEIAGRGWPTVVYVTDDNPRSEDPAAIRAEIMVAAPARPRSATGAKRSATAVGMLDARRYAYHGGQGP
jgi:UDP-N-acetylmuramoyl-L-alanyl-D-glutamate--2,6-diaminopimelate ligase